MAYDSGQARVELLDEVGDATDDLGRGAGRSGRGLRGARRLQRRAPGGAALPARPDGLRARAAHPQRVRRAATACPTAPSRPRPRAPSQGVKGFIDAAVSAVVRADARLAQLQDSMRPVEVGDAELRAGLSEVRRLVADVPRRASEFVRGLGR